jgi:hypothetical protein
MGYHMTDDQAWRIAITSASTGVIALLFIKAKAYLSAKREESGRILIERISYRLGALWARTYLGVKSGLRRS